MLLSVQFRTPAGERVIKTVFFTLTAPLLDAVSGTVSSVDSLLTTIRKAPEVREENKRLRRQIEHLQFDQVMIHHQLSRTTALEKLLQVLTAYQQDGVVSEVVARGFTIWDQGIVIRGGTDQNLEPELPVFCAEGVIGHTLQCSNAYSQVALMTNAGFAMSARIRGTIIRGMIHGQGEPLVRFDYVTISAPVKTDDLLVSTGDDGIFPPELMVGRVVEIKKTGPVFQEILVQPAVDVRDRHFVLVLRKDRGAGE
ncbi:MAG: rod shape-determining protein MreC [Acidobacteria bacterium]|nr:rod shape-determining protein MreC [Acidobacteriota bacterium]